jgi:hypothetical protein
MRAPGKLWQRAERAPAVILDAASLERGERVLAFAQDDDRWLLGTRLAIHVVIAGEPAVRLRWESVQAADWTKDDSTLRLSDVGEFGAPRSTWVFVLEDPALLLQLIRERVTASVVLQRGVLIDGKLGFKVIGRRSPDGGPIAWMHEYDAGIDPDLPAVQAAAAAALAAARSDVGEH